jgi:glycerophosphoryl diester phosphodiesterase
VLLIAHRGAAAAGIRENTLEAYAHALAQGATWVELDVHVTADGALVIHHDGVVEGTTIAAAKAADLPAWVPTLDAALDACGPAGVTVEIKAPAAAAAATRVAATHRPVLVSSFSVEAMATARATDEAVGRCLLYGGLRPAMGVERAVALGCERFQPWDKITRKRVVDAAHAAGLACDVFTPHAPDRLRQLARWGVDGVFVDDLPAAREALAVERAAG